MFEHAQMQKALSEAFTFIPTYLGQLGPDHWYAQYRDMEVDFDDDDDFFPEGGEYLARSESDEQTFFAWKMENGRLLVACAHYPEFSSYSGADLYVEVLPATASEQEALNWVKERGIEGSYVESEDEPEEVEDFISSKQVQHRPSSGKANGRQLTFWEKIFGAK